jgi:hypothetical protein
VGKECGEAVRGGEEADEGIGLRGVSSGVWVGEREQWGLVESGWRFRRGVLLKAGEY